MKIKGEIAVNKFIYKAVSEANTRFVLSFGGAGSGKSYTQAQSEVIKLFKPFNKTLVIRKVASTLIDSCIPLVVNQVIPAMGAQSIFELNKSDRVLTNTATGSQMLFRGLDDPEKIKSIAGINRIWIEEASELTEADFDQLNLRLRGGENLQMILTFNPIDENHWIKKRFFDREDNDVTIIKSTYKNNPFIDEAYKKQIEKYKTYDWNYYRVYALGEWGKLNAGGEFYKEFKPQYHVKQIHYNSELPLHLSFDENVNPYPACTVWQTEGNDLRCIDEVCLCSPNNTLGHTLIELKRRYRGHASGVFIYGDATSKKADTKLEKGHNFFTLIRNGLSEFRPNERVPPSNPSVVMRGLFINEILSERFEGVSISISDKCKNTIGDLNYVKEASDGTKLKAKEKDPRTGVSFEPYGHTSDTLDYFVCRYCQNEFLKFQRGGDTAKRIALHVSSESLKY